MQAHFIRRPVSGPRGPSARSILPSCKPRQCTDGNRLFNPGRGVRPPGRGLAASGRRIYGARRSARLCLLGSVGTRKTWVRLVRIDGPLEAASGGRDSAERGRPILELDRGSHWRTHSHRGSGAVVVSTQWIRVTE